MDLIAQLAGTLGLEENQAQALAGTVIGGVQSAVADEDPEKAAATVSYTHLTLPTTPYV